MTQPEQAICPNGHPWNTTMRACRTCRLPNPDFDAAAAAAAGAEAADAGEGAQTPGQPTLRPPLQMSWDGPMPAPAVPSFSPLVDVDASISALKAALAGFREKYGKNGSIVGVFGSPNSGKSFLNARLRCLTNAKLSGTVKADGFQVINGTALNTATWAELDLVGYFEREHKLLVIDLPGEEFEMFSGPQPKSVEQYAAVLDEADALLIYMSAELVNNRRDFGPNVRNQQWPPQEHYLNFLKLVFERRAGQGGQLSDLPIFMAFSRADRMAPWEEIARLDPWKFLCEKSPPLAAFLVAKFSSFCCGFLASHVGAQNHRTIEFAPVKPQDDLAGLWSWVEGQLQGMRLRQYFLVCLQHQLNVAGPVNSLPGKKLLQRFGMTEEEFEQQAAYIADSAGGEAEYERAVGLLAGRARVNSKALVDNNLPSYGVHAMLERLTDLIREPRDGVFRRRRFSQAAALSGRDGDRLDVFSRLPFRLGPRRSAPRGEGAWPNAAKRLLLRVMTRTWDGAMLGGLTVLFTALGVLALVLHANHESQQQAQEIRELVRGIERLPQDFALDPQDVWLFGQEPQRLEDARRRLVGQVEDMRLEADHLLRAPDIRSRPTPSGDRSFYAVMPAAGTLGGLWTRDLYAAMECESHRACGRKSGVAPELQRRAGAADNTMAQNYARALYAYWSDADATEVNELLKAFENARNRVWSDPARLDFPDLQLMLPQLMQRLMRAHVEFRADMRARQAAQGGAKLRDILRAYGERLDEALGLYTQELAKLRQGGDARRPRDAAGLPQALQLIGVEPTVLNAHLLATALAQAQSLQELKSIMDKRWSLYGTPLPEEALFNVKVYANQYPDLLCFHQQMRRADNSSMPAFGKPCQYVAGGMEKAFGVERWLVSSDFWTNERKTVATLPYENYTVQIRRAAQQMAQSLPGADPALRQLMALPDPPSVWSLLLSGSSLLGLGLCVLAGLALSWLLTRMGHAVLSEHRLKAPFTPDVQRL